MTIYHVSVAQHCADPSSSRTKPEGKIRLPKHGKSLIQHRLEAGEFSGRSSPARLHQQLLEAGEFSGRSSPARLHQQLLGTQQAVQPVFNLAVMEGLFGIISIRQKVREIAQEHATLYHQQSSSWNSFFKSMVLGNIPEHMDSLLLDVDEEQNYKNGIFESKIHAMEKELTAILELEQTEAGNERSALDRLFDSKYTVKDLSLHTMRQKQLDMLNSMYLMHLNFLLFEDRALDKYEEHLENYRSFLRNNDDCNLLKVEDLIDDIKIAREKIREKRRVLAVDYDAFETKHKLKLEMKMRKVTDLIILYKKYSRNREGTLKLAIQALKEVREYVIQDPPTQKKRQIMNNLCLVYELLSGDDPNTKLFRLKIEKSLIIDASLKGFSSSIEDLEEDPNIPESIERIADVFEMLPKVIALFEGMKSGSFWPLISLSLFAEAANIPFAWVVPLLNIGLGAYENVRHVNYIQKAHELLSEKDRMDAVSIMKDFEKKCPSMSDLQQERLLMGSCREFIHAENGHPSTHIFQRVTHHLKDFSLKLHFANTRERVVRLIGQVGIPALIFTSVMVEVLAALVGLTPVGIVIISTAMASIIAISAAFYASYQVGDSLSRWIDEYYKHTTDRVNEYLENEKAVKKLTTFLALNRSNIDELIDKACKHADIQVMRGNLDKHLKEVFAEEIKDLLTGKSEESKLKVLRQEYLKREKTKIRQRLEAAAYLKAHQKLRLQDVDVATQRLLNLEESYEIISKIIHVEEPLFSKEEIKKEAIKRNLKLTDPHLSAISKILNRKEWLKKVR